MTEAGSNQSRIKHQSLAKKLWPIQWKKISRLSLLSTSLKKAAQPLRVMVYVSFSVLLISMISLFFSLYYGLTKQVGAEGGVFREAVVGGNFSLFNPVLDRADSTTNTENNLAEKKINSLIYAPLYTIEYPNFLTDKVKDPTIKPVLLKKVPEWLDLNEQQPENRFKKLSFEIRDDIVWSDGKKITLDDIEYTFDRLKDSKGSPDFRNIFSEVTLQRENVTTFTLLAVRSKPELYYLSNFSPISKAYFENQGNESLYITAKSFQPQVTSGRFYFPERAKDPDSKKNDDVENPIKKNQVNQTVVLKRSKNNTNYKDLPQVYLDQYVIKRYDSVFESKQSVDAPNLVKGALNQEVDLFSRSFDQGVSVDSEKIRSTTSLNQSLVDTNKYLSMYLNIKKGPTGFLVNQSLRKYITCNLLNYENKEFEQYFTRVPKEKQVIPLEFGEDFTPDCGTDFEKLLDPVYVISKDEKNGLKRITIGEGGTPVRLTVIGLQENILLLTSIQNYFLTTLGIPVDLVTNADSVFQSLQDKEYHIALLPNFVYSRDVYNLFEAKEQNLVSVPSNDRISSYEVNKNLLLFSRSGLKDAAARAKLVEFFSKELVTVNLYQVKQEVNYSKKITTFKEALPNFIPSFQDIYILIPNWYSETKRVLK
jgi:Bacterial extracellular solute-binding proteins, family 5 Middle